MAKGSKNITGEIKEIYKVIERYDDESELLLCDISWNDRPARTELRIVKKNGHFGSGLVISKKNIKKLSKCIDLLPDKDDSVEDESPEGDPVDFDEIFKSAKKIDKLREEGYVTKNGKIALHKK